MPQRDRSKPEDGSELPPEKAAANKRADSIASRREHPEFAVSRLQRPQAVLFGCIMAWIGCLRLAFGGWTWTQVDADSSVINQEASPEDIESAVQGLHFFGGVVYFWALVLLTLSLLAFFGRRWAATGLVVLAGVSVLVALAGLLTALSTWFLTAAVWSVVSASLVRFRETSKDWYKALAEARALKAST